VLPTAAITTFAAFLRAHERPDRELSANLCAAAVACVGIIAIDAWGLLGAIIGLLASCMTTMLVLLWWVVRIDRVSPPATAGAGAVPVHVRSPGDAEVSMLDA
jgi:hypothetical protein